MLPKQNRANRKTIEKIFKKGTILSLPGVTFRFILTSSSFPQISVIVPKNVSKVATKRNLLRRQGYDALVKYIKEFPNGIKGAYVFKKHPSKSLDIENEIKNILKKLN